jgi:hypothetical protein
MQQSERREISTPLENVDGVSRIWLAQSGAIEMEHLDKLSLYSGDQSAPPAPWIFVRGMSASAPGYLPIIIAPHATKNGRRIIGTNDSSVELMKPSQIRDILPTWKKGYAGLGIALPAVLREYDAPASQER